MARPVALAMASTRRLRPPMTAKSRPASCRSSSRVAASRACRSRRSSGRIGSHSPRGLTTVDHDGPGPTAVSGATAGTGSLRQWNWLALGRRPGRGGQLVPVLRGRRVPVRRRGRGWRGRWRLRAYGVGLDAGAQHLGRAFDGLVDLRVSRATAEVAGECFTDLLTVGQRVAEQEPVSGHQNAGRAEPALRGAAVGEGGLERVRLPRPGEAFDGGDLAAHGLEDGREAGEDGLAVDEDGAGAAVALVASLLGAGQAEDVPERL